MPERVKILTVDEIEIIGDWMPAPRVIGAVVLVHMLPETRASWAPVQQALMKRGFASLAIDLRGHGDSTKTADGDTLDYQKFGDEDHQSSVLDIEAAVAWVRTRGIELDRIAIGGASIGANLALLELVNEPRMAGAVLLSPALEYHGVSIANEVENILPDQHLVIVSAENDTESFEDSKKIYGGAASQQKLLVPYKGAGHGTNLLSTDAGLADKIAEWFAGFIAA